MNKFNELINNVNFNYAKLTRWSLVKVSGDDRIQFLQGQLTNDITQLDQNHYIHAGHCDPKGKLIAPLILFTWNEAIFYFIRQDLVEIQTAALKKYAVFSKVTIQIIENVQIESMIRKEALLKENLVDNKVLHKFNDNRAVYSLDNAHFLAFDEHHFIRINLTDDHSIQESESNVADDVWDYYFILSQYPILSMESTSQFLPQAFNLDALDGINYKKGCYCGQEMIARAHYRGINKRKLITFATHVTDFTPKIGTQIEQVIDDEIRQTGFITAIQSNANSLLLQVVLSTDTESSSNFTLNNQLVKLQTFDDK